MAAGATTKAIVDQPTPASETENYVLNLNPSDVAKWSVYEVVHNFVEHAGLGYLADHFLVNKINGKVLMLMTEHHLIEMGVTVLGDRIYLMELITLLKKKKKEVELSSAQWSGVTPAPGIAYKADCGECCLAYCCPCCLAKVYWRVTKQGVFYKKVPPCGLTTGSVKTEYLDYRFFKDLELKRNHRCLCCCAVTELEIYVDDHSSSGSHEGSKLINADSFVPHILRHPEAEQVGQIIRNEWSKARLVAD